MSDDKMRSEFEAEFPLPAQVQWDDCLMKYKPREYCGDRGTLNRCHTLTMMLEAWQAAQRQGGEAVAWIVMRYDDCVGICADKQEAEKLSSAMNAEDPRPLYTAPQPAVPEGFVQLAHNRSTGEWLYLNHAEEWHTCPAPEPPQPQPDWTPHSADAERLDWLDQRREDCVQEGSDGEPELYAHAWGIYEQADSIREAIDMNMKRPEPPEVE